jgi:hypothetical protein
LDYYNELPVTEKTFQMVQGEQGWMWKGTFRELHTVSANIEILPKLF